MLEYRGDYRLCKPDVTQSPLPSNNLPSYTIRPSAHVQEYNCSTVENENYFNTLNIYTYSNEFISESRTLSKTKHTLVSLSNIVLKQSNFRLLHKRAVYPIDL